MPAPKSRGFMKYFLFLFVFIIAFCLFDIKKVELFGLTLFLITNLLFFVFIGKDFIDNSIVIDNKTAEWQLRYGSLLTSMVFSFVSSIMMIMTLVKLQGSFSEIEKEIQWSPTDRQKLDDTKIIFTAVTAFIGVSAVYIYYSPEEVRKFTYFIFSKALDGPLSNWMRILFPIVIIGLGSALYGRLQMPPLEVNKVPTTVICDPENNISIQSFKDSFIKTFWFLFAFVVVVLSRPFIEANFSVGGINPSHLFGFNKDDRSFVYGNNPYISLISLLTLGLSNLFGLNRNMSDKSEKSTIENILLAPIVRWDTLYSFAKYAFGLVGLVYAGFSIRDFENIPKDDSCLYKNAHIRQLYIAFIVFLIVFYFINTLTSSMLTSIISNVMRYLVPPSMLALSSYLVFITNYFAHMAPKLVIQ